MSIYKMYEQAKGSPMWEKTIDSIVKCFDETLKEIKEVHPDKYKIIKEQLYIAINGYHFNDEMLNDIYKNMINDNGTKAPKWTVEETTKVGVNSGVSFNNFNEYDWNYVMNMIYSDYCEVLGDNLTSYVKMADKFINDKDAPEGKALRYAMCMKKDG